MFTQIDEQVLLELISSLIQSIDEKLIFRQILRDFLIDIKKVDKNDEFFRRDEIELDRLEMQKQIQNEMQMIITES